MLSPAYPVSASSSMAARRMACSSAAPRRRTAARCGRGVEPAVGWSAIPHSFRVRSVPHSCEGRVEHAVILEYGTYRTYQQRRALHMRANGIGYDTGFSFDG